MQFHGECCDETDSSDFLPDYVYQLYSRGVYMRIAARTILLLLNVI